MQKLIGDLSVSRETFEKLERFADLILKWQKTINLISRETLPSLWDRHILDSAQLFGLSDVTWPKHCVDIGSGGGLPGIVIGIILAERQPATDITLIESDQRKATFLRTAIRECELNARVHCDRIESASPVNAGLLTARALAPISELLPNICRHVEQTGVALLHKGAKTQHELEAARQHWHFDAKTHQSLTHPDGKIVELRNIARAKS